MKLLMSVVVTGPGGRGQAKQNRDRGSGTFTVIIGYYGIIGQYTDAVPDNATSFIHSASHCMIGLVACLHRAHACLIHFHFLCVNIQYSVQTLFHSNAF